MSDTPNPNPPEGDDAPTPEGAPEDDLQAKFSRFMGRASTLLMQAGETVREQATRGREMVDLKMKERELNQHFQLLGKEIFRRYTAGDLELPPSFQENLDAIGELIKDIDLAHKEAEKKS